MLEGGEAGIWNPRQEPRTVARVPVVAGREVDLLRQGDIRLGRPGTQNTSQRLHDQRSSDKEEEEQEDAEEEEGVARSGG
jgi:hypothetical protein